MHSCILYLGFRVFENFWGFFFLYFCEIFGLGVIDLMLYAHALHFNNVSCILDVCLIIEMFDGKFGLGLTHDPF